jgi:Family of unknown function (DUF5677)
MGQQEAGLRADDAYEKMRSVIYTQTRNLDRLIHMLMTPEGQSADEREIIKITVLMIQGLGVTMHSVLKLTAERDMAIRDCYGMARSAFELAVNICYIAASNVEVARLAERHAMQKSYRNLQRKGDVGGFQFEISRKNIPSMEEIPGLSAAISEFTRNGKELSDWTPHNISARIKHIKHTDNGAAVSLSGASMSIYRHASELLHGTYFSVVYFWSANTSPAHTREQFEACWKEHFLTVFTALFFSTHAVISLFSRRFDLQYLANTNQELSHEVKKIIDGLDEGGGKEDGSRHESAEHE